MLLDHKIAYTVDLFMHLFLNYCNNLLGEHNIY